MKIRPVRVELFHADRLMDRFDLTKLTVAIMQSHLNTCNEECLKSSVEFNARHSSVPSRRWTTAVYICTINQVKFLGKFPVLMPGTEV